MSEEHKKDANPRLSAYLEAIASYERDFKKWEGRVDKILKRYRDERPDNRAGTKFNVLWSNIQTLVPACFSRIPQPDVSRRFRDNDPVGRVGALILERSLEYMVQHYPDYKETMKSAVRARFLGGRGVAWIRYEPHFKQVGDTGQVANLEEDGEVNEQLDYECVVTDYVNWKDFGHNIARSWGEVTLVWRKVYMGKRAVEKRFGKDIAKKLPYDASPTEEVRKANNHPKKQACIYELCDKDERAFVWLSKSYPDFLDEREDPMRLEGFFPCPKPLYATMTEETLVPVPDFTLYQDQANSLDVLADRIYGLCEMLQVKGVYDGSADAAVGRLFTEGRNGTLLPVKNWAAFAEKNGLQGALNIVDLKPIADALKVAVEAFIQKKSEMDELSGVIDVIRGQVNPNEKLGQTEMKGQFAGLRLKDKQQDVAEFATQILQIMAQIICTKFQPQTIAAMAAVDQLSPEDQQLIPQAMALLIGQERLTDPTADEAPNPLRSFRISIAADTLVEVDEQSEKQDRMELMTAFGGALEKGAQIGAVAPALIPLVVSVLKFCVQSFKVGKSIEGEFDNALDQLKQMVAQQQGQPQKSPEQVKAETAEKEGQIKIAVKEKELQLKEKEMSMKEQHMQREMAMDAQQQQAEHAMAQQQMQQDAQMNQQQSAMRQQEMSMQHEQRMQQKSQPNVTQMRPR